MASSTKKCFLSPENLVKRSIKLIEVDKVAVTRLMQDLSLHPGISATNFEIKKSILSIQYDAARISIEEIEHSIKNAGLRLDTGIWSAIRDLHYRYVDQCIKDNNKVDSWSFQQKRH